MIHIAGNPPYFNKKTKKIIETEKPNILIYGHSHILKVKFDKENKVLLINPGAAGRHGFHKKEQWSDLKLMAMKLKIWK